MNARVVRSRTSPGRPDVYVLITWSSGSGLRHRTIIDWYILADSDAEFEGRRIRADIGELFPGGETDLEFWLGHVEADVRGTLQARVDQEWLNQGRTDWPPTVVLEPVPLSELLSLRLRGRGQAGIRAVAELARDGETQAFAWNLLELVQPIVPEALPKRTE